jgi:hypothetical protein
VRRSTMGAVGLLTLIVLVGCDSPPSEETRSHDVAQLEAHVLPVVDELDARFYLDEGSSCNSMLYPRGEFRDGDVSCGSPTESYGPFDATVRSDFDHIRAAIEASRVNTHRFDAFVTADGVLRHVSFPLEDSSIEWNWGYLYDPNNTVSKGQRPNAPTYQQINDNWWLVTEIDD